MITQGQINSEIDLSKRIYIYYFDKMADLLSIGSDKYIDWYKDLCSLYFITNAMLSVYIEDGLLYLGGTEIDENDWHEMTARIREFINYDIRDIVYAELDSNGNINDHYIPSIPPTVITYSSTSEDWRSVIITIEIDDVNSITLPFNISQVDPDSITVDVNDNNPIPLVAIDEEGCTIVGSTLSLHTYFNFKAGDKVFVRYLFLNT